MTREMTKTDSQPERHAVLHEVNSDLAVIICECGLLEDIFAGRADAAAQVQVIKNAAQQIADKLSLIFGQQCFLSRKSETPVGWNERPAVSDSL